MANYSKYKPSGKASVFGVIQMIVLGLVGVFVLMMVYLYGVNLVPNMGFRVGIFLVVVLLLSAWMHHLVKIGRIRAPGKAFWLTFFIIIIGFYPYWAMYVVFVNQAWDHSFKEFWDAHISFETLDQWVYLMLHPKALLNSIKAIEETGFFSIRGHMVSGSRQIFYWVVEGLLLLLVPSFRAMSQGYKIFSETQKRWQDHTAEFTIAYIKEHRSLRRQLLKGDMSGLADIHYYPVQGQEAHGTITFYHHKGHVSRYASIQMIKAVQIGPRKMKHFYIPILEQWDLGEEMKEEVLDRLLTESGLTREKVLSRGNYKERHFLRGKKAQLSEAVREKVERSSNRVTFQESGNYKPGEEIAGIEEVTVYAPTITPEMEQEYLAKRAKEEQERIWAENREEIKNRKNKSKRRSTRIK